jgi:hypothetical protein
MSWEVHVTRADHWTQGRQHQITLEEWLAYAESDSELAISGSDYIDLAITRELALVTQRIPAVAWLRSESEKDPVIFWWAEGSIDAKNPTERERAKMFQIATHLNAKVQGDDGELYDEHGLEIMRPNQQQDKKSTSTRTWWRRLCRRRQ